MCPVSDLITFVRVFDWQNLVARPLRDPNFPAQQAVGSYSNNVGSETLT